MKTASYLSIVLILSSTPPLARLSTLIVPTLPSVHKNLYLCTKRDNMLIIDNILVPEELFKQHFVCNLSCCKGICCVEGDAGAPLEEEEISILEDCLDEIKPFMTQKGIDVITQGGVFDYDMDGVLVTPLINDNECAFVYFEDGIVHCAIEKAYMDGKIDFQKPISCHLYPVRITKHNCYERLNYHQWEVCNHARMNGKQLQVSVFEFLRIPFIRKYGEEWIKKVEKIITMQTRL